VDRYFQLAKCFRDEDGRKDRQPEFTQIDLEMAFVSWGDTAAINSDAWRIGGGQVRDVVESLVKAIWKEVEVVTLPNRFDVMTYRDAMTRFGSDKPDTRFGLEILGLTHLLPPAQRTELDDLGEVLECITVRTGPESDRPFRRVTRKGDSDPAVERITLTEENMSSWLSDSNTLGPTPSGSQDAKVNEELGLQAGDSIWLARRARDPEGASTALGRQRLRLSELAQARGDFLLPDAPHFLWITEFPLFTRADKEKDLLARGRWSSSHHPFTALMWQDLDALYSGRADSVRGQHYDLVLNGVEIGGGSVRVHDAAMQEFILSNVLQLSEQEKSSFGHLLHALKCGAPPHGGMALGFDRLMSILCKTQSIRDVIAFPKTSVGTDPLFKSPAAISRDVLEEYGIRPR
jgi:aspartyl-tRNA synthetase